MTSFDIRQAAPGQSMTADETSLRAATCPACGERDARSVGRMSGYVEGPLYGVLSCGSCGSQSVTPRDVPEGLYDAIYASASVIEGGYDRYVRYAAEITSQPAPLEWLAAEEDMYWGVHQCLQATGAEPGSRIIEAGAGLGYLTYALRKAGYDARGVDVSRVAVEAATRRFGSHYTTGDATDPKHVHDARVVIAMELIEHLADPTSFLLDLRRALPFNAVVIVSTPNRDTYPATSIWNTDLPPVHLQWFSEAGIASMARRCGYDAAFVDFTPWNARRARHRWIAGDVYRQPRFDATMRPIARRPAPPSPRWTWARVAAAARRRVARLAHFRHDGDENRLFGSRSVALVARLVPFA